MAKFIQIQAVTVRAMDPKTGEAPHDEVEVYALDEDGKVYRNLVGRISGWHEVN